MNATLSQDSLLHYRQPLVATAPSLLPLPAPQLTDPPCLPPASSPGSDQRQGAAEAEPEAGARRQRLPDPQGVAEPGAGAAGRR